MSSRPHEMVTVSGLPTGRGLASGPVFLYRGGGDLPVPEYVVEPGCVEEELIRFERTLREVQRDLEGLIAAMRERTGRSDVMVFECHQMILEDPMLRDEVRGRIREGHVNAEAAVRRTAAKARAQFERMNDAYFRERVRDIDDIERRLLKSLMGFAQDTRLELKTPAVVVADDLTPSETVQLPRSLVLGFATNGGSTTSHVALLARALGIPAVTGLGNVTSLVRPGAQVLLDGNTGTVTVDPDAETLAAFERLMARQSAVAKDGEKAERPPAGTLRDGSEMLVFANLHPGVSVEGVKELGARGIGLYRSEYLWLNAGREPTEEEQFRAYREAAEFASTLSPNGTLTIRTLDIGGDKLMRGISSKENNPFLGNRSIRYLLANRDVFRTQLRAILRASAYGRICVMHPMVSCIEEIREARNIQYEVSQELDSAEIPYDRAMPVGIMVEIPSAALNADALAKYVDFFSIGTNDLIQYTMAADRGNDAVAHLYQPTNPAVLRLIRMTMEAARAHDIRVGVCGESASDPIFGILWAAMGADMLSMSATYIPSIAGILRRLTRADLDEYAAVANGKGPDSTAQEVLEACRAWMEAKIPDLEDLLI